MDEIFSVFTMDNITLALSIFGSVGTVLTWVVGFFKNRKRFTIEINGYFVSHLGLLLHIQFVNKSAVPLAINEIAALINGNEYICEKIPQEVLEVSKKRGSTITSHREYFSMDFPINLASLCGTSGYLYFSSEQEKFPDVSNEITLIIRTNRGLAVRRKLSLNKALD